MSARRPTALGALLITVWAAVLITLAAVGVADATPIWASALCGAGVLTLAGAPFLGDPNQ